MNWPTIVIDKREKTPLAFTRLPSTTAVLETGDYTISGAERAFSIERKTVKDMIVCSGGHDRERFERTLHRLRAYQFARLLIIGRTEALRKHKAAFQFALAAEMQVAVVWAETPELAAVRIECWAMWFAREVVGLARGIQQAVPAQFKGISSAPGHEAGSARTEERV